MIGTIKTGVGSPGKLWTGDRPADGPAVISIIERVCPCGASTRKFRASPLLGDATAMLAAADFPVVHVATGGVESLVSHPRRDEEGVSTPVSDLACWNWSGRIGGYVIVAPIAVAGGYVAAADLPPAREAYVWLHTYAGSSLSEYVLLRADLSEHAVPVVKIDYGSGIGGVCPPCREKAEKALQPVASGDAQPTGAWSERAGFWLSRPVGSRSACLTVYRGDAGALVCETGCFRGALDVLEARVAEVHGAEHEHGRAYFAVIAAARAAFASVTP